MIRPILDIPRKEIEEYCREHDLSPVEDHTNHQSIYTRNKIRLELLPELEKEYNENVRGALLRLGKIAASDSDYLQQCAEEALQEFLRETSSDEVVLERDGLAGIHEALRHRILLQSCSPGACKRHICGTDRCCGQNHRKETGSENGRVSERISGDRSGGTGAHMRTEKVREVNFAEKIILKVT